MAMTTDQKGDRGELLARAALSRSAGGKYQRPLFRAAPLGEKFPVTDLYVELLTDETKPIGFFFVQIKSTFLPTTRAGRLPIRIRRKRYNDLARIPAPRYVVGVDLARERSYLVAVTGPRAKGLGTMAMDYSLEDGSVMIGLYEEVRDFWATRPLFTDSRFRHD